MLMLIGLVVCIIATLAVAYFAFAVPKGELTVVWQTTTVILLCASLYLGYRLQQDSRRRAELALIIAPYPDITDIALPEGTPPKTWMVETRDPPEKIEAFYREESHHQGWDLQSVHNSTVTLHRQGQLLNISPVKVEDGGTSIVYTIVFEP